MLKGDSVGFWNSSLLQNIKNFEGGPFRDKKLKKSHKAKKVKEGAYSLVRFCISRQKWIYEGDPLQWLRCVSACRSSSLVVLGKVSTMHTLC